MEGFEVAGRIGSLAGRNGELNVATFDNFPTEHTGEPLFVVIDNLAVPLFVGSLRRRGRASAIIAFDDIDTPTRASELVGLELLVPQRQATVSGAADDLTGFAVTIDGKLRGEVTDFIDNAMNPLLEIAVDGKTVYVPAVGEFIKKIDRRRRTMTLELPEGLMELYV